jgi:hypothetical protein
MLIYYLYYIIGDDLCVEERLVLAVLVMRLRFPLLLALLSHRAVYAARHSFDTHDYYVLEHDPRVGPSLSQVATRLGVQVVERAGELDNFWVVRAPKQQILLPPEQRWRRRPCIRPPRRPPQHSPRTRYRLPHFAEHWRLYNPPLPPRAAPANKACAPTGTTRRRRR